MRTPALKVILWHAREGEFFYAVHDGRVYCPGCDGRYVPTTAGYVRKHLFPSWKTKGFRVKVCPGSHERPALARGPFATREEARAASDRELGGERP